MTMDMTHSIEPNSQQVNAEDLISGPRVVTITGVEAGSSEQPVFVHLAEFPDRTYRPSKSMRRVMVAAWGPDSSAYAGRRMEIYREPTITFGKDAVGGIRISSVSHIDKTLKLALAVSRGKRSLFTVQPLADAPAAPTTQDRLDQAVQAFEARGTTLAQLETEVGSTRAEWDADTLTELTALYKAGDPS